MKTFLNKKIKKEFIKEGVLTYNANISDAAIEHYTNHMIFTPKLAGGKISFKYSYRLNDHTSDGFVSV